MKCTTPFYLLAMAVLIFTACQKDEMKNLEQSSDRLSYEQLDAEMQAEAAAMAVDAEIEALRPFIEADGGALPRGGFTLIPAGSVNMLNAAIQEAPSNGLIVLDRGVHTENATVLVDKQVRIVGRAGATLQLASPPLVNVGESVPPGIHIFNANKVIIHNIDFVSSLPIGGIGILIENGDRANVNSCHFDNFQYNILNHRGNNVKIKHNEIVATRAWLAGTVAGALGIVNINGTNAQLYNNKVSNCQFGIWACDVNGRAYNNETTNGYIGIIVCKVPAGAVGLPDGSFVGSSRPGTSWRVRANISNSNFNAGILVIDGANNNVVGYNNSRNNGTYDFDIVGDSNRFSFFTPKAYDNWIVAVEGQSVKDCGENTKVTGGDLVDNNVFPCF